MTEQRLRALIESVRAGAITRRDFTGTLLAWGLGAPVASQLLLHAGLGQAQQAQSDRDPYKPTRRGGGGALKLLWWQAPTLLNPHFASGTKDTDGSRIFYEPLAGWDAEGNLVPILAAEVPTLANGGISKDRRSVVWKLKRDVQWHDGKPFTSADVVFNWEFATDPATAAITLGQYKDVKVSAIDALTVRVDYAEPQPFWALPFVGASGGQIIPKHLFEGYRGAKSREAPANLKPVGTGPYKFAEFVPGDVVRATINPNYHMPNRPHFDTLEMKGGGDAVSAARAVLQTGEFDYAWNLLVEDEVLVRMEKSGGKGRVEYIAGGTIEYVLINFTDPWIEVDGERSSIKTRHPVLSDRAVREALNLLVDRNGVQQFIYGRAGIPTANFVDNPPRFRSKNTKHEFSIDKASQILEAAGWKKNADGIREKGGRKLRFVFQTSVNQPRQKTQAIIKQACQKAGIELELKAVVGSVFFSTDVANPDTNTKFYCDLEMYAQQMGRPDPQLLMRNFLSSEVATKANKWQGLNVTRWRNDEYDRTHRAAETELDPVKRAAHFIKLNDLLVGDFAVLPIVARTRVSAVGQRLRAPLSGWDSDLSTIHDWHRA